MVLSYKAEGTPNLLKRWVGVDVSEVGGRAEVLPKKPPKPCCGSP